MRPFSRLSEPERDQLHAFIAAFDPRRFADPAAMREAYLGAAYAEGQHQFSLWQDGRVRGAIALVAAEVAIKGEAYLVGAYVREGDRDGFRHLITQAFAVCPDARPTRVKLGLAPGHPHLMALAAELGFEEGDASLVLSFDGRALDVPAEPALSFEAVTPANQHLYRAVSNAAFRHAPNGGSMSEDDMAELLASQERPGLLWLCRLDRQPAGVLHLELKGEEGWLTELAIAPEHQGRGLAKHLLRRGVELLSALGPSAVKLLVMRSNDKAVRLYRRYGFGNDDLTGVWLVREGLDLSEVDRGA